jgi:hypothetical protein
MSELTRPEAMQGVAALAATRFEGTERDMSDVDEWPPLGHESWFVDAPDAIDAEGHIEAPHVTAGVDIGADAPAWPNVWYKDSEGVGVGIERERDADDVYLSASATFDTDAARDLAAAIYRAAEELDTRRELENANTDP